VISEDLIHLTLEISWLFRPAAGIIGSFIKEEFQNEFFETERYVEKRPSLSEDKENLNPNVQQSNPFQSPTKKPRLGSPTSKLYKKKY
jgi:hypothetical protein